MAGRRAAAAGLVAAVAAAAAVALEVPPPPERYFTDYAGVVPSSRAEEAEQRLAALEQRTGHQVIAVIFRSLEGEALEDFTIRAAERWKVGRKGLDDGIIFFAFIDERRLRLEVGYGLEEKITDALSSRLLADVVRPEFRKGDYGGGVIALAAALDTVFRGEPLPMAKQERKKAGDAVVLIMLAALILLIKAASRRGLIVPGYRGRYRGWGGRHGGFWGGFGGGFGGGGFSGGGGFVGGGGAFGGGGASGSW